MPFLPAANLIPRSCQLFNHLRLPSCREKAIRARIQELEQQQQRLVAAPGGGDGEAECGAGFAGIGGAGAGTAGDGEEVERELWLLQADLAALQVRVAPPTPPHHTTPHDWGSLGQIILLPSCCSSCIPTSRWPA